MSLNSNQFNHTEQQQANNQTFPISTNRLLLENDTLTYKYNQYKQSLLKPFQSQSSLINTQQDLMSSSESINLGKNSNSPIKDVPNKNSVNSNNDLPLCKSLSNILLCNSFPETDTQSQSITQLKKEYDNRILSLYNNLRVVISKIQTDDFISAMQNDINSSEFISSRIKEILDEDFYSEKETYIAKLSEENSALKAQLNNGMLMPHDKTDSNYISKVKTLNVEQELQLKQMHQYLSEQTTQLEYLSKDNQALKHINNNLNETIKKLTFENTRMRSDTSNFVENASSFEFEMNQANKILDDSKKEIERLNKVISVIEIDLNSSEDIIKEKTMKNESLVKEVTSLQNQLFDSNLKLKKATDEKKSLQSLIDHYEKERKELYSKCSMYNEDIQNNQKEKLEMIEKKQKEKITEAQQKLMSQKEVINTLESELTTERSKAESVKEQYSKMYKEMQENIKIVSREWEKKLKKEQEDFEHIIQELETKHSIEMNGLIRDNAVEIEAKQKELVKYKQTIDQYKNIDKEFIKIPQHENLLNKAITDMKKQHEIDLNKKGEEIQKDFEAKLNKLAIEKKNEYNYIMQTSNSKQLLLENDNATLKQLNNTLKTQLDSIKADYSKTVLDNNNKDKTISQLNSTIDDNNKVLKNLKESKNELINKMNQIEQDNSNYKKELMSYKGINDQYQSFKNKTSEMEQTIIMLTKDNQALLSKLQSSDSSYQLIEAKYNDLLIQLSEMQSKCELTKRENHNYSKQLTSFAFNQRNQNELLLNLLNSKVKAIKKELSSIKDSYKKNLNGISKDIENFIRSLHDKANKLLLSNNSLKGINSSLNSKLTESQYKNNELQSENNALANKNSKLRLENELLTKEIENEKKEKAKQRQLTHETESIEKSTLREMIKKLQSNLSSIVIYIVKLKKNYTSQISTFKSDIEDLCSNYTNDFTLKEKQIEQLRIMQDKERKDYNQLKNEFQLNRNNLSSIQSHLDKLKEIYENKITLLNTKASKTNQEVINSNRDLVAKSEQIDQLNALIQETKGQNKALKTQLEVKRNEMQSFKADFEKLMGLKDRKIKELQMIVNQSFSSYNSGVDDIHMAKRLDDEVRVLKQKSKNEEVNNSINYNKDI